MQPYGLDVTQIATIGCVTLTAGIISALNFGKLLDRTKKYRFFLIFLPIANFAALAWFGYFSLENSKLLKANLILNAIFFGASIVPVIPLCMSFSVEVTFPIQPSTSNGVIILLANLGAFGLSILGTFISQKDFELHPEFDKEQLF
jgi:MFS family permease